MHRLAELSGNIIDQCVAQGVPFAREYGGVLSNRTFGGVQVSRTFYARGQTGQQLLLGAYGALMRQVNHGKVKMFPRREMLDVVVIDGLARGIICRNLVTGQIESYAGHAVLLCTGGYGNAYYLSTNAKGCNVTAAWRCYKRGAFFANPCYTQIHPTCIPVTGEYQSKLTLMSESLRNDGRVWVPLKQKDTRSPDQIPESERDYFLERRYPAFGNMVPRDVASRAAKERCDSGFGVGSSAQAVYLDFADAIRRDGEATIRAKYSNLFNMYQKITAENGYHTPMRIYPAIHYTMGGLWVDYYLQSTIPGLFVLGEANFSDHGANRLGASALMQGLADGYFIAPYTVGDHLATKKLPPVTTDHPDFRRCQEETGNRIKQMLSINGKRSVESFHRELGKILWEYGLDSTHALIVAARTMDRLGLPRQNILGYTMPGFATSDGTRANALGLMDALGVTSHEIDIKPSCLQMLRDIGHPFAQNGEPVYDITFENVQAGERTSHLFRLANFQNGIVLGTGDLSELALGWATYGVGDHMSHYNVNASVPKTLIQYLLRWVIATKQFSDAASELLQAIVDTEISPELVPHSPGDSGASPLQSTQEKIGPYELQDFNVYYTTRYGFRPSKVAYLAHCAWADRASGAWPDPFPDDKKNEYDVATIKKWLGLFLFRFFQTSQFKRSAVPNGPKVGSGGSLSPRGDWRAPSDSEATVWLKELQENVPD